MDLFRRSVSKIAVVGGHASAIGIGALSVFMTVAVLLRRIFNAPILGADEISGFTLAFVSFMGFAYTLKVGGHITIDVLVNRFSPKWRYSFGLACLFLLLAFTVVLTKLAMDVVISSYQIKVAPVALPGFPIYLPQLAVPLGLVLLSLTTVVAIIDMLGRGNKEKG